MTTSNTPRCPFETVPPEESNQINETTQLTVKLLEKRYAEKDKEILRGVHPKSHGCVKAIFEVNAGLDEVLQVGLFSQPKKFDAIIRFSNAEALVKPDIDEMGDHGSRGMAIKVFDVEGEMLLSDNSQHNQDFLMINQPMFAFANTPDYLRLDRILYADNDNPATFFDPLKLKDPRTPEQQKQQIQQYVEKEKLSSEDINRIFDTFKIVQQIKADAVANPLNVQYFSAAPFLFGADRVMKFSAKPRGIEGETSLPENPSDNYLQQALEQTLKSDQAIVFDFMVQVREPSEALEIENSSALWDEVEFPFINVATVTIPSPQAEISSAQSKEQCELLAYTPWHSLKAHQPIGSINRLRKSVYQASAEYRHRKPDIQHSFFTRIFLKIKCFLFGN